MTDLCNVPGCLRQREGNNRLCHFHRQRKYRGIPFDQPAKASNGEKKAWLEDAARRDYGAMCVKWPFKYDKALNLDPAKRYGAIMVDGIVRNAHNYLLRLTAGEPPEGKPSACHRCGDAQCLNPAHLYWGSAKDNCGDMVGHGTRMSGEKHHQARLSEADVKAIRESNETATVLMTRYGMDKQHLSSIRSGRVWADAKGPKADHRKSRQADDIQDAMARGWQTRGRVYTQEEIADILGTDNQEAVAIRHGISQATVSRMRIKSGRSLQ